MAYQHTCGGCHFSARGYGGSLASPSAPSCYEHCDDCQEVQESIGKTFLRCYRHGTRCNRFGCAMHFNENPDNPTYKGGRYRKFCSDSCRKAEKRRIDNIVPAMLATINKFKELEAEA